MEAKGGRASVRSTTPTIDVLGVSGGPTSDDGVASYSSPRQVYSSPKPSGTPLVGSKQKGRLSSKKLQSPLPSGMSRVNVSARVRPKNVTEGECGLLVPRAKDGCIFLRGEHNKSLHYDHVFGPESTQREVYGAIVAPLVADILKGINSCVIAYGQTGAGKTYTLCELSPDAEQMGMIPRAVQDVFAHVTATQNKYEWDLELTFYHLYMEAIQDLLRPERANLPIREGKDGSLFVEGLSTHKVRSLQDVLTLLEYGARSKIFAHTKLNRQSSRSHTVLSLHVIRKDRAELPDSKVSERVGGRVLRSTLMFVDLAGSERASRTHPEGKQFEEAKSINRSLSALGNVIAALSTPDRKFIPWRDSKLTRLLQRTLGGNSRTSLIINTGPSDVDFHESLTSLRFGMRAMQVAVHPVVNQNFDFGMSDSPLYLSKPIEMFAGSASLELASECKRLEDLRDVAEQEMVDLKNDLRKSKEMCAEWERRYSKIEQENSEISRQLKQYPSSSHIKADDNVERSSGSSVRALSSSLVMKSEQCERLQRQLESANDRNRILEHDVERLRRELQAALSRSVPSPSKAHDREEPKRKDRLQDEELIAQVARLERLVGIHRVSGDGEGAPDASVRLSRCYDMCALLFRSLAEQCKAVLHEASKCHFPSDDPVPERNATEERFPFLNRYLSGTKRAFVALSHRNDASPAPVSIGDRIVHAIHALEALHGDGDDSCSHSVSGVSDAMSLLREACQLLAGQQFAASAPSSGTSRDQCIQTDEGAVASDECENCAVFRDRMQGLLHINRDLQDVINQLREELSGTESTREESSSSSSQAEAMLRNELRRNDETWQALYSQLESENSVLKRQLESNEVNYVYRPRHSTKPLSPIEDWVERSGCTISSPSIQERIATLRSLEEEVAGLSAK